MACGFTYKVGPDLVAYSLLVHLVCVLREVVKECHASASVWTGIKLDQVCQDNGRVFLRGNAFAELQHERDYRGCRRTAKLKR